MSRTGDTNPSMDSRVDMARNNGTDMLLSIHIDGGGGSGGSVHYFNEYSYEAAGILWEKMHEVEKKYGIGQSGRTGALEPVPARSLSRYHGLPGGVRLYG